MKFLGKAFFLAACVAAAQSPQSTPVAGPQPVSHDNATQLAALVKQQFGPTFSIPAKFVDMIVVADFDADGSEDVAIVANSKEPMPDSYEFKYDVADPYHAYFGFGDPRIMASFNADPERSHDLLVIFGNGKEGWHAAVPKAKFVLINVPFDSVEGGRMLISKKKPPIFIIRAVEAKVMDSAIWWDARKKRWHWEPGETIE